MEKIFWTKEYQEDVGTKDEQGWYDYAYRYYIYWFTFPNRQKIKVRRYTDTPDHCSIFLPEEDLAIKKALDKSPSKNYIFGVVNFLLKKEGAKTIDYYNMGYKSIDLSKVRNNRNEFVFEEGKVGK
ncbi:hypothetical protein [Cytophaga hutchinsonii]|jgi:hypothetical protein|uniref:Uncharacterized protein n=1 Tax=Cytophaga hutchinsonii (strain ATCC 33406 / DSM 1761 / CIP 103989 / NBRC 15051 / NCIMB 9469 / D465) TaxID=269798 RepID=A0A6N4SQ51_CYTH3|nr:hypothetical protein [Cytophaga hutchinsonii]ABG58425.1 hypothetical protein CHU_1150 [Cytophaga hutchinsonii ATCC 33406]SFX50445.1 hypothetical protein SAMN04487930_1058 [Cytophaga hutchinsonii ATCC 33406]